MSNMPESERRKLWSLAHDRCAICDRELARVEDAGRGGLVGIEVEVRPPGDGSSTDLMYGDAVLLCAGDRVVVAQLRDQFDEARLRRLKSVSETLQAQRQEWHEAGITTGLIRVRTHIAGFEGSDVPLLFIKIINDSLTATEQVESVWFATEPPVTVQNPARRLPTRIGPCETFETWIGTWEVPFGTDTFRQVRVSVGGGTVVESERNEDVSPAGAIGGAGTPLSEVRVDRGLAGSDDPAVWDVFISHATQDKDEVARPLKDALVALGVSVWFDEAVLGIGDSLRRNIDRGIARSAFGVAILSQAFFTRGWTNYELDGMVTRDVEGLQNILPIWHKVTKDEVMRYSSTLADRVGRSTSSSTVGEIADEIARRVRPDLFHLPS